MPKLSKTKSFSVSEEIIEVDFQGTTCEVANLLKSGLTNQTIVLVAHADKWHEINVLNLGGDDSNLKAFKKFIEDMKLSLTDLGITTKSTKKTSVTLTHDDFLSLSEKFPPHEYIQISLLNDYNVKSGGKSSIDELTDWLKVCQRDKISINELIKNREIEKQKIIMEPEKIQELEVNTDGQTAIPVEKIETHEAVVLPQINAEIANGGIDLNSLPKLPNAPTKKPISLQVFETLTPERISELQGLNERQLAIVKENPVIQITDKTTYETAKKTAAILLKASTTIDGSTGIEATATKYLNTFKNMLKTALQPIAKLTRDPYDEQKTIISAWENAELLKQQALEREKLTKIKKRTDELFAVPFTFNGSIYSIGTVYCTPSQVETISDEDFNVIVENGKVLKKALDADALVQSEKDARIAELEAKLAKLEILENMSNMAEPEPAPATIQNPVPESSYLAEASKPELKTGPPNQIANFMDPNHVPATEYVMPPVENILLNRLDLENTAHLEKPAYIKCRGYYVRGLKDVAVLIEGILNNPDVTVKKSVKITELVEILKKSV